jgi:cardiolipin synthase
MSRFLTRLAGGAMLLAVIGYLALVGPGNAWRCLDGLPAYLRGFNDDVATASIPPLLSGNRLQLLIDGNEALPVVVEAIESAEHHIHLQTMIFVNDGAGQRIGDALIAAAGRGVRVRLLFDHYITRNGDPLDVVLRLGRRLPKAERTDAIVARLEAGGVLVRDSYPPGRPPAADLESAVVAEQTALRQEICLALNHHDHRKLLIVDGQVAFVGGLNVSDEYYYDEPFAGWHDVAVRLEGPAAVEANRLFVTRWRASGGDRVAWDDAAFFPPTDQVGGSPVALLAQRPGQGEVAAAIMQAVAAAEREIWALNPYINYDPLLAELVAAARRGVRVVMIVPDTHNDEPTAREALRRRSRALLDAGVELYDYHERMSHAKVMLIDDHWVTLGSFNLNHRSFNHDLEANILVDDPLFAAEVRTRLFEVDLARSRPIQKGRGWRPTDWLLGLVEPFS